MNGNVPLVLAVVIILGAAAQWLAWALRLPSILLLLVSGFLAGPVLGWIQPDQVFGALLLPFVSLSVALILFEGGLSLRFVEIRGAGGVISKLVTLGAAITWGLTAVAAHVFIGLDLVLSVLLGAILIVTGPTVVLPLLRHIRPTGPIASVLKWEGIVIDPIGAILAVLVFETIASGRLDHPAWHLAQGLVKTVVAGGTFGVLAAGALASALRRYWVPDHLQAVVATMLVVAAFLSSNLMQPESGLFGVTVMGIALANQRRADIRPILEFKENLRVFLLSAVFILLSARLRLEDLQAVGLGTILFIGVMILVVRPLAVLASTLNSPLKRNERLFAAWMAPRGIVAAAMSAVFALELEKAGYASARLLVPVVFATIVGTVVVYGVTGRGLAKVLGLSDPDPQGLLIVGGDRFGVQVAEVLQKAGLRVLFVDTNRSNIVAAQLAGLAVYHGNILAEDVLDKLDLAGIGRLLALTSNHEVNTLAAQRLARVFGRERVYQLPPGGAQKEKGRGEPSLEGRALFSAVASFSAIALRLQNGATVKATKLTPLFDYVAYRRQYGDAFLPLVAIADGGRLTVFAAGDSVTPRPSQVIVSLVGPADVMSA